ncbi:unnamed protein product, partial [Owenia fusiformis]
PSSNGTIGTVERSGNGYGVNLTNLQPGELHCIDISAELNNLISAPSHKCLLTDEMISEEPRNVRVTKATITSMSISWDQPRASNGRIINFRVYHKVCTESQFIWRSAGTETSYTIPDLNA